jgi:hypothetical protein
MITMLPEYNGSACDITGNPMINAVGYFARGATGRVCLVLACELRPGNEIATLSELREWAESEPNGYLDY